LLNGDGLSRGRNACSKPLTGSLLIDTRVIDDAG
jgi:hypothetical protein